MAVRVLALMLWCGAVRSESAPVIDMMHWRRGDGLSRDMVARDVAIAARDFGFFFVHNHGVAEDLSASADAGMREFFQLPLEVKQDIAADKTRALKTGRGYATLREEQLDVSAGGRPDLKEVLDLGLPLGATTQTYLGPNPWPKALPGLQNATEPYLRATAALGSELLTIVSRSLSLPEDAFAEVFDEPLVVQRLMRYPAKHEIAGDGNATEPDEMGCGAHYDFGGLTLLRQTDAPGLEVQPPAGPKCEGACQTMTVDAVPYGTTQGTFYSDLRNEHVAGWLPVVEQPGAFVVTFGEALQRLTNGRVQATRHRVVHEGASARHSMAVFVDPNPHREVAPLPGLVGTEGAHYASRLAGHKTVLLSAALAFQQRGSKGGYLGFGKV